MIRPSSSAPVGSQLSHFVTRRTKSIFGVAFALLAAGCFASLLTGCRQSSSAGSSARIAQQLEESKTQTDNLRTAMQFLDQMKPLTRDNYIKEVQLQLNTWLKDADRSNVSYSATRAFDVLPSESLEMLGANNPLSLSFGYWDVDYLFECRTMNSMAKWIVEFELHDAVIAGFLDSHRLELDDASMIKLTEAHKLFDWTVRNIRLQEFESQPSRLTDNPTQLAENSIPVGCDYLPWETALFSRGDFIERGRVFTAMAAQRGIDTYWVAVDAGGGKPGKIWAIAVAIADQLFLFEPKHGFPIVDPDASRFATLAEAASNERILRRLNLPGQFDYALSKDDLKDLKLYIDVAPCSDSSRMKMLQTNLLNDERMTVYHNVDDRIKAAQKLAPGSTAELWRLPMLAQLHAGRIRELMRTPNEKAQQYMAEHAVWLTENPVATGRFKHLQGEFENTDDGQVGALKLYIESRIDDQRIAQLEYSPEVREDLGVTRMPNEPMEMYAARVRQAQIVFSKAKRDADFLRGQLLFDRGKLPGAKSAMQLVIDDESADRWHAAAFYTLARVETELGNLDAAAEALTHKPTTQEAGNRLRLRYLRRMIDE